MIIEDIPAYVIGIMWTLLFTVFARGGVDDIRAAWARLDAQEPMLPRARVVRREGTP